MKTFFAANLGLAPFALFWLALALTGPAPAALLGLAVATVWTAWRRRRGETAFIEVAALPVFAAIAAAALLAPAALGAAALPLSFLGLGVAAFASVALGRPWTADYARAAFAAEAASPIFDAVNRLMSALWGAIFVVDAGVVALGLGGAATAGVFAFGALASILGPRLTIRAFLSRRIRDASTHRWPAPDFAARPDGALDVAVVGAGLGGLVAAALLADVGLKVAVFDAHVVPGGYCHDFLRKARWKGEALRYRFDAGPHDFSGIFPGGPTTSTLERLGIDKAIRWRRLDHSYRIGGRVVEPPRDWRAYARSLGEAFPEDAAGFAALFEVIHAIYAGMYATGRGRGGIPGAPQSVEAMLAFPRQHPEAARWLDRPFAALLDAHLSGVEAKRLILALSGYVTDRPETLTCGAMVPLFGYYFNGGYYPEGGSGALSNALAGAIADRGGEVRLKTRVAKIRVERGRAVGVELASGERVDAAAVVAAGDFRKTFLELVDAEALPAAFLRSATAAKPAASAFMVHLGVDFVPAIRPSTHVDGAMNLGVQTLSLVDPAAAPPGHATVGLITLVGADEARGWFPESGAADDWKALRRSPEYQARKRALGDAMIAAAEVAIPGLAEHIVYRSEASPVTFARYDLASDGAIYGTAGGAPFRGAKSPVPGLVVAGAATHGPGAEAAIISGAEAAEALLPGLLAGRALVRAEVDASAPAIRVAAA